MKVGYFSYFFEKEMDSSGEGEVHHLSLHSQITIHVSAARL